MLTTDEPEFLKHLRVLFGGLDKPLGESKEKAFWKALNDMSLIEFGRCVDFVLEELKDGDKRAEYRKSFTPGEIWATRRRLRSRAAPQQQNATQPVWTGDGWDIRANRLLLGYIGDQARVGVYYSCAQTQLCTRKAHNPSEESDALTAPLIAYKNAWADDMREATAERGGEAPPIADQRRTFMDCMRRADEAVDEVRAQYAQMRAEAVV